MQRIGLRRAGAPLLAMTLVAMTCSIPVADAAGTANIGTATDVGGGRQAATDHFTIEDDWRERLDRLTPAELPGLQVAQAAGEQTAAAAQAGDEPFETTDQSGNDPRDFTSKFMPYYRFTELENDIEVSELVMFGFFAFNKRFGMTYEIPVAKEVDFKGSNSVGMGDTILRFFLRPESGEFTFGQNKNLSLMPLLEFTAPTATESAIGGDALIMSPGFAVAFDAPFPKPPFSLGFFALMNFYDFDAFREKNRDNTSRVRGRWFWMQPLSKPTPQLSVFDFSGLYIMTELQPVYDIENEHFSFWIGPEFGKILAPGHVLYVKPGFGIDPDADEGDRDYTVEVGYRFFFN